MTPWPAELSWRSLGMGAALGALLACCNLYMGLKLGWFDTGSLTAALLGVTALRAIGQRPTPAEANVLQTLASAMATMPSTSGLIAAVPALVLLGSSPSVLSLVAWSAGLGLWGVLLALPLRAKLLEGTPPLPFPTGTATAELISTLETASAEGRRRARVFLFAALPAAALTIARDGFEVLPPEVGFPVAGALLGFSLSPLSLGAGVMAGAPTGLSLCAAGALAAFGLAPLAAARGWTHGAPEEAAAWLVWPGVGLLLGAALPSLKQLLQGAFSAGREGFGALGPRTLALGAASAALLLGSAASWGLSWWAVLLGLLVSAPLVAASTRAAGQTDVAPLAPMGQLTQLLAALFPFASPAATVLAGAVPAGAGATTANTFWTLKAGRLLGLSDGPQLLAQALGAVLGAAVCAPLFALLLSRFTLGSAAVPAPWALQWKVVAELVAQGPSGLPAGAAAAGLLAFAVGLLLALLPEERLPWLPSPVALGLGLILPLTVSATMLVGGLVARGFAKRKQDASVGLPLGTGALTGESVTAVAIIAFKALGVL